MHRLGIWPAAGLLLVLMANCAAPLEASEPQDRAAKLPVTADGANSGEISFSRQIAPILLQRCLGCHGADDPQGKYVLQSFAQLREPGYSDSPIVTPGAPEQSELYLLVATDDESIRMPSGGDPLPVEEVELIRQWIASGASYDAADPAASLASIIPRQRHPTPPETYRAPLPVTALAFSADGSRIYSGGYHELLVWEAATGKLLARWDDMPQRIYDVAVEPSGNLLAVAGGTPGVSGEVRLLQATSGELIATLARSEDVELTVAFSHDGTRLVSGGANRAIRVYAVPEGVEQFVIEEHADWVLDVAFNADGTRLVSASRDKTAKLFDAATGESLLTYPGHREIVYAAVFESAGEHVLTGGRDRKIQLWKLADATKAAEIGGFRQDVLCLIVHDAQLYCATADGTVRQHQLSDRAQVRVFSPKGEWVYRLTLDPAAKQLAAGSFDGRIRIWNVADGQLLNEWIAVPPAVESTATTAVGTTAQN